MTKINIENPFTKHDLEVEDDNNYKQFLKTIKIVLFVL